MDRPQRAEQVRQLFDELVALEPAVRAARLRQIHEQDASLGQELAGLLAGDEEGAAILDDYQHLMQDYRQAVVGLGAEPAALIGQNVGPYIVLEWLGGGGMGHVFKAWDTRLERTVALKFLPAHLSTHEEAKQRFMQEAKAATVLDHPNICTIYEIGESEARQLFIAMPCYGGETLSDKIARGPVPIAQAIRYAMQVAEGLQRAHEVGIVHRDVKPANVMVTEHEHVKLLDFGIAKIADMDLTRTGTRLGTVAYMSPEHARGEPADHRMDVWSLGVMLYEMLTGKRPFQGPHEASVLLAIQNQEPVPVQEQRPEVPPPLAQIVERALQKDPTRRYASMQAMLDDLRPLALLSTPALSIDEQRYVANAALSILSWRQPLGWALLAGVVVLVGIGAWLWAGRNGQPMDAAAPALSIGVMYFDNLTGEPALEWVEVAMVEMLTANLGQFDNVEVLSSQRLFDIMRQVSGEAAVQVDRSTATEIARRAGVRTMLLGSVLGDQQHLRLNTQLVDAASGDLVGSEVVDVGPDASLFTLVDSLTQRLAARLEIQPADRPGEAQVAYTLTSSPEALRHYVEGLQAMYRSNFTQALEQFDAAVASDSTFAMAYYHRELAYSWQTGSADRQALERALRYGDRISERERALIEATFTMLEDLPTRKAAFEGLTARYPDEKFAWYQLGEILYHNYWPRRSVEVFSRAAELDPHFLIAYIHLADVYFHTDEYDKARPLLDRVLALDSAHVEFQLNQAYLDAVTSEGTAARGRLVHLLQQVAADSTINLFSRLDAEAALTMMERDFTRIEGSLLAFRQSGSYGTEGYVLATHSLAGVALLQGDLAAAERYLREARQRHPDSPSQLYEEGLFWLLRARPEAAHTNARKILELHGDSAEPFAEVAVLGWHLRMRAYLEEGNLEEARQALASLEQLKRERESEYGFLHEDALGRLACNEGRTDAALQHFGRAQDAVSFTGTQTGVVVLFRKLLLDAQLGCLEQAGAYETLLQRAGEVPIFVYHFHDYNTSTMAVRLRTTLRQARAYEALGQIPQAIAAYEAFLSFWKDAALPGVREAQIRLAALKNSG